MSICRRIQRAFNRRGSFFVVIFVVCSFARPRREMGEQFLHLLRCSEVFIHEACPLLTSQALERWPAPLPEVVFVGAPAFFATEMA